MIHFLKHVKERKAKMAEEDIVRRSQLFLKLDETLDETKQWLVDTHSLTADESNSLTAISASVREGMRMVLIDRVDAFDNRIPEMSKGGAIIANSACAYSELSIALQKPDLESMVGSTEDKEATGHICYQLDFSRDGLNRRS